VVVFRNAQLNAFVLPGGKIGINTGILRVTENPDQLAAIIGHEVAHVLADHANERMTQELGFQAVFYLIRLFGNDEGDWKRELVEKGLGLGARYGVLLPYSRIHEQEADALGLQLMARAGFDPRESLDFWRNMAQVSRDQPPELMSTHPSHHSRVETLQGEMDQALKLQQAARKAGKQPDCALP
jgi:predicted Zn-dependent protease